jgi:RHS repeat-associated protein
VSYSYDAFNQLVKRTVDPDGATGGAPIDQTFYVYEEGQVALEFHQTGAGALDAGDLSHRYLWADAVDHLLADEQVNSLTNAGLNNTLWALADHLGTVRDAVDNAGKLRLHREYDAFGNVVAETHYNASGGVVTAGQPGFVDLSFAFTGRQFDKATGLQNNLNRWYDPRLGRWMSEDPIGHAAGDANLYRYVGNEPTLRVDSAGLQATTTTAWWFFGGFTLPAWAAPVAVAGAGAGASYGAYKAGQRFETKFGFGEAIGNWWNPVDNTPLPSRSLPMKGPKNGILSIPGHTRAYGADGYPLIDVDSDDSHPDVGNPHSHDWDRPYGGGRPYDDHRGPPRPWRPGDPPPTPF